ncbi:hypothetical protein NLN86_23660 [Citrobacter portucalensis]|uniref:Uncharacterized protein n=1 Tax=Citrobacter portucalensis TaxID=1639133 RepID=A0AAW5W9B0_9ENTR|nr:hypothetical protein [Citrobacter portucalensis]MCX9004615.1 hypothetical protein [Citrobacter portucalensis]MCX9059229.1 hypothetical protein [Citrobacter portucalensis]
MLIRVLKNFRFSYQEQFEIAFYLFTGGVIGAISLALYLMMQEEVFLY